MARVIATATAGRPTHQELARVAGERCADLQLASCDNKDIELHLRSMRVFFPHRTGMWVAKGQRAKNAAKGTECTRRG
ncbi:unnamed protein product, partial [Ectocarpus sp. 4 AP-2014]